MNRHGNEGKCADDRLFADLCPVHHHGIHANQRAGSDAAAVQDGAVPDDAAFGQNCFHSRRSVDDAIILETASGLQDDPP